ncbi:aldo/keto reductase [Granulosicoccus antarcticus]|uniref:Aldo/keto reductase n=1 Tax=Granulosicoccus antarcticus IMCC3135 TaxID=1192854 RepID=A0A2Z2P3I2_9GAMM|nr:aldo/keto reductase [Granulosicoccus antarcticus]ASJ74354.1 Aldo/keto reductase [Granulosicoccus antarcticus IMCC3135]
MTTIPTQPVGADGQMPVIGLGLWKIDKDVVADAVVEAIRAGYRHLDSACDYGNEKQVGEGIRRAIEEGLCTREDLWVTSKLWNTYHHPDHVVMAMDQTLDDLGLDYLDLYMVHFPIALEFVPFETRYPPEWVHDPSDELPMMKPAAVSLQDTWRAMETLVDSGLARHIGVCNYGVSLMRDLLNYARIEPAVLQIESHPYLTQDKLVRFCAEQDIAVTAFSPLGALSYLELGMAEESQSVLQQPSVIAIAERLGRTPAQVILRWGVQRGNSIIPKTSRPERLLENAALFDFELTDEDMAAVSGLNRNQRFNDPGVFTELAFNTFFPIYE